LARAVRLSVQLHLGFFGKGAHSMASKKTSGSKKPARKKKVDLKDLSSPSHELSEGQAKAVKGGKGYGGQKKYLKYQFE
jgi:hypothetical protein